MTDTPLSRLELLYGAEALERLRAAKVIIFGVGGVGSWCVEALARCDVGHITLVDSDTVAPSNINRQLPALHSTIGQNKVDVMARRIADINPDCRVQALCTRYTPESADSFELEQYDAVVDAIDSLADKANLILRTTAMTHPRLFASMGAALKTDIEQIHTAEFAKVKGCPLARALRQRFKRTGCWPRRKFPCVFSPELKRNIPDPDDDGSVRRPNGTVVFATATFGLMLARLVVNHLIQRP